MLINADKDVHQYSFSLLSNEQFLSFKEEWDALLTRSDANTLFLTWDWLSVWWAVWSKDLALQLNIIICRDHDGELVGIAPLYRHNGVLIKKFPCVRLAFIGTSVRIGDTVRSEFLDFIVDSKNPISIRRALFKEIYADSTWDEMILADVLTSSATFALCTINNKYKNKTHLRMREKDVGVNICTKGKFSDYLAMLGKNTRNSSFTCRNKLSQAGDLTIITSSDNNKENLALLNRFHLQRWGKKCFDDKATSFHQNMLDNPSTTFQLSFTLMKLNNVPISISYNIFYEKKVFNLQLGFSELENHRLAIGSLNLGFVIEKNFNNNEAEYFDLLLGSGKNIYYKDRYKGKLYNASTLEIIRNPYLRTIFKFYDYFNFGTKESFI